MTSLDALHSVLRKEKISSPTLVIYQAALDYNIHLLNTMINGRYDLRLVVKSLPSIQLLEHIVARTQCSRFMCFHAPFLKAIVHHFPNADVLLGKPLPASAFADLLNEFLEGLKSDRTRHVEHLQHIQWLIDTPQRLAQYAAIAEQNKQLIRINLEIDIGLHRGGFKRSQAYLDALKTIKNHPYLEFAGLMGYEAHASKLPKVFGAMSRTLDTCHALYKEFKSDALSVIGNAAEHACYNSGGSTTISHYEGSHDACSELSVGSVLLKPSDFDLPHLESFKPAVFIATPILKVLTRPMLPGPEWLSHLLRALKQIPHQAVYIYGGKWLASPCFPEHSKRVNLFGHSSNQELYGIPSSHKAVVDELMLFRPHQSESVMLQFEHIALLDEGILRDFWQPLNLEPIQNLQGSSNPNLKHLAGSTL